MEKWIIVFLIFVIIGEIILSTKKNQKQKISPKKQEAETKQDKIDYTMAYKQRWLFSYNEKDAYWKIKSITDKLGMQLMAKVRLYDLIEPKANFDNFKGAQWKIQAKHVDFVVCDAKLVAKYIIEIDDGSHEAADRRERDSFVDEVLTSAGYKVIRLKSVDATTLEAALSSTV